MRVHDGGVLRRRVELDLLEDPVLGRTGKFLEVHSQLAFGTRNLAIDLSRRRKTRDVDEHIAVESLIDPASLPELDVITREQMTVLWEMLGRLPEDVREMLVLRYMLGWQVKQIASHLEMLENTVTVTIKRTLKTLQRDWSQEKDHE